MLLKLLYNEEVSEKTWRRGSWFSCSLDNAAVDFFGQCLSLDGLGIVSKQNNGSGERRGDLRRVFDSLLPELSLPKGLRLWSSTRPLPSPGSLLSPPVKGMVPSCKKEVVADVDLHSSYFLSSVKRNPSSARGALGRLRKREDVERRPSNLETEIKRV